MKKIFCLSMLAFSASVFSTTPHAYVTEFEGRAVSVIDVNRDTVQKIFGFERPHVVRVTFDGTAAYVGDANNDIYKINCLDHTVSKIGTLSSHPIAFCILPDASYLYAATAGGTVVIINLTTDTIENEIGGLNGPQDIKATPNGNYVYVTNKGNGTVSVIKTVDQTYYTTITGFQHPIGIVFDVDGNYAYISDNAADCAYVVRLSDNKITNTILGLNQPRYIAVAPRKTTAYISNGGNDTVSILRLSDNFITGTIPVPNPSGLGITPDGLYLYVASGNNDVFKIAILDNSIQVALPKFSTPTNISFADNNVPYDTVNGWQVENSLPYNQISWFAPAGAPYQYRIFRDNSYTDLLATVPATNSREYIYNDLNRVVGQTYAYYVIADYSNDFSSTIGSITVTSKRVGLPR